MEGSQCEKIIGDYYRPIYLYCYSRLDCDSFAADDCAQEVFLTLLKKKNRLVAGKNIKLWLYRTADNVIKKYIRKNRKNLAELTEECCAVEENIFEVKAGGDAFDLLTDEELSIVTDYYGGEYASKSDIADKYGITLSSLYKKIYQIKKKLKSNDTQKIT
ncbi:MAG: RNA polymerase sigma factor [Ruminococcus sp.]